MSLLLTQAYTPYPIVEKIQQGYARAGVIDSMHMHELELNLTRMFQDTHVAVKFIPETSQVPKTFAFTFDLPSFLEKFACISQVREIGELYTKDTYLQSIQVEKAMALLLLNCEGFTMLNLHPCDPSQPYVSPQELMKKSFAERNGDIRPTFNEVNHIVHLGSYTSDIEAPQYFPHATDLTISTVNQMLQIINR